MYYSARVWLALLVLAGLLVGCASGGGSQQALTPERLTASSTPGTDGESADSEAEPTDATGYLNRGAEHYKQGNYDKAIADFDKAIALDPNDVAAYINRGSAYVRKGQMEKAIADYDQAIDIAPDYAEAYTGRGAILYVEKAYEEAIEDFTQAIEVNPEFSGAYYNRGLAYLDLEQKDQAIADFERVVELGNEPYWTEKAKEELQQLQAEEEE
jgi:tetratricopeptide (TPR) repeat protein